MTIEEQHTGNTYSKEYTSVITFKETEETENAYDICGWKFVKVLFQKMNNKEFLVEVSNEKETWVKKFDDGFNAYELYSALVIMPVVNISKLAGSQFKKFVFTEESIEL
jgi:hypothetical protein